MDLGLLQKEVAAKLGASNASVNGWEVNAREPELRFLPAIIAFLGYDPGVGTPHGTTGAHLRAARRLRGLSQFELARLLGVNESTIAKLEADRHKKPSSRVKAAVEAFLAPDPTSSAT